VTNNNLKKQLSLQEPFFGSKDKFFGERMQDYLRLEENLLEPSNQAAQEIKETVERLNVQTGAYGARRKELINNLFRSIIELSTPSFIEYLFWLIENKGDIFGDASFDDASQSDILSETTPKR